MKTVAVILLLSAPGPLLADKASWYGESHRGRIMSNGQPFNPDKLTVACWHLKIGTQVRFTNRAGLSVVCRVSDRGPRKDIVRRGVRYDLSRAAFEKLAGLELGIEEVKVEVLK